jgi:hypothetical protein
VASGNVGWGILRRGTLEQILDMGLGPGCGAVVPNGVCTGLDIGLSNFSLSLITLSFYTMCKSTTPIFLLVFAFLWGIER